MKRNLTRRSHKNGKHKNAGNKIEIFIMIRRLEMEDTNVPRKGEAKRFRELQDEENWQCTDIYTTYETLQVRVKFSFRTIRCAGKLISKVPKVRLHETIQTNACSI